ncbi:helix-turn-helix transcriptional regulator [Echinicola soli]|uniref:helix-turn-helix transcriptional regulator n=1 Tax=Echinicola soli TaxID=2591634 RepID=UPI001E4C7F39|nr:sigma-70 region 4 domain-containing protein [Echinicola soli]
MIEKGDLHFLSEFNEIFPDFISKIKSASSKLNAMDIKFCVLLKMGFTTKEIASVTKSTVRAVQSRKYRIRKRLDVPNDEDLNLFMVTFS